MSNVDYQDDRIEAHLVIRAARVGDGIKRAILRARASEDTALDEYSSYVRGVLYPDLTCALDPSSVFALDGKWINLATISVDEFAALPALPDDFIARWYEAVYAANPQWRLVFSDPKALENGDRGQTKSISASLLTTRKTRRKTKRTLN
jgi:hypothetical protein